MNYKTWLFEFEEKNISFYRNIVLSKLELDKEGLSQSLNVWDPERLLKKFNELGEFKKLSPEIQGKIENQIKSKSGTVEDLIKTMSMAV
jgi:hypothetical protein